MKLAMKTAVRFVVVLGLICLVMGSGVAVLYAAFKGRIAENDRKQFEAKLQEVLPAGKVERLAGSPERGDDVYVCRDESGEPIAYAARGEAQGYSSRVRIIVGAGADAALSIRKVAVLDQQETPGLGADVSLTRSRWTLWEKLGKSFSGAAEAEPFENKFLDKFTDTAVGGLDQVDAMTAATITSNAVKSGVREAVERIRGALKEQPRGGT